MSKEPFIGAIVNATALQHQVYASSCSWPLHQLPNGDKQSPHAPRERHTHTGKGILNNLKQRGRKQISSSRAAEHVSAREFNFR
jgi:hypothetical protein